MIQEAEIIKKLLSIREMMIMRKKILTPIKAIRSWCVNCCMGGPLKEVRFCDDEECPLYLYRMGKNPSRKGMGGKNGDSINK